MFKIRTVPSKNSRLKENGAGRGAGRCSKPSKLVLHPLAIWIKELGKLKLMILSNVLKDTSAAQDRRVYEGEVIKTIKI